MHCPSCGRGQPDTHRFCFACGSPLPNDLVPLRRPKVTNLFLGIPTHAEDPPEPVLRVSRYLDDVEITSGEGSVMVPGRHVRVSIWVVDRPVCAMSLTEDEAERLGRFLLTPVPPDPADERAVADRSA
jgi:hypothetical protein